MAVCDYCGQEMTSPDTVSCTANARVDFPDGGSLPSVPFTPRPRLSAEEWMAAWRSVSFKLLGDSEDQARQRCATYQARWDRCHDCGIGPGGYHHPGCDGEVCPRCGGQLIRCGCLSEDEDEDVEEE